MDRGAAIEGAVRRQYAELFAAFPAPTYATYGNVDLPRLWPEFERSGVTVLDGETVELGGLTFGFVGGGLPSPMRTPFEISDEEYAAKVAALGRVDVLCTHIPPAVPELTYDTVARRFERGSEAVLAAIREIQPRYALFGHVHQPLVRRMRIGRTECVNVGHFNATGRPWVLDI
jgi:Icc-related predicted phosphoesterase